MEITTLKKELLKKICLKKNVYLMAHKNVDLDAFGSMAGLSLLMKKFKKKVYIIIDDEKIETATSLAIEQIKKDLKIIKSSNIEKVNNEKAVLIILDVNNPKLTCNEKIINKFNEVMVIDHHNITKNTLKIKNLFINSKATSTCEIVAEVLSKFRVKIPKTYATIMLGGIALDTNNFTYKMTKKSFYICYYLTSKGADIEEAQFLLKQDLKEYIKRSKIVANTKITDKIAIASGVKGKIYSREELAKTADLLLSFKGIQNAFAIGNISKKNIGISARSLNKLNAGKLMEEFGGGGNANEAAAIIEETNIKKIEKEILEKLK